MHTHETIPHDITASRAPAASLEPHTGAIVCNGLQQFAVLGRAVHRTGTLLPAVTALRHDPRSRSSRHRSDLARTDCQDTRMALYPRRGVPSKTRNRTSLLCRRATTADASGHTHEIFPHDSAASRAPVASLEPHTGAIVCNRRRSCPR